MANEAQEIDVERIMQRIRENLGHGQPGADTVPPAPPTSPFADGQVAADFAYLHSGYDINNVSLASHRRVLGSVVLAAKQIVRKLLAPILERQVAYNAASTRVMTQLKDWVHAQAQIGETLRSDHARLRAELGPLEAPLAAQILAIESRFHRELGPLEARLAAQMRAAESRLHEALAAQTSTDEALAASQASLAEELGSHSRALQALTQSGTAARERMARTERTLRRALDDSQGLPSRGHEPESPPRERANAALPVPAHQPGFDYSGFEERFRGSEDEIKERQRIYVPYFEGRTDVVDIGCGRGEFLELMRERGIRARGVDVELDMILLCREKGLDVGVDDAFGYLGAVPDESLGGVFAAQVIEHLHPQRIVELVTLCHRKLGPGGVLILETPNPKCLMVFADAFYKDPSHIQPAHPDTMQFLFEALDFHEIELRFLSPVDPSMRIPPLQTPGADLQQFNEGIDRLNTLLFGFQDYAVIGMKSLARASQSPPAAERDS